MNEVGNREPDAYWLEKILDADNHNGELDYWGGGWESRRPEREIIHEFPEAYLARSRCRVHARLVLLSLGVEVSLYIQSRSPGPYCCEDFGGGWTPPEGCECHEGRNHCNSSALLQARVWFTGTFGLLAELIDPCPGVTLDPGADHWARASNGDEIVLKDDEGRIVYAPRSLQRMAHGLTLAPRDDLVARVFRFIVGHMAWYLLRARPALRTLAGGFLFWTARGRGVMRTRNAICAGCPRRTRKTESEGIYAALFFILVALGVGGAVVAASFGVASPLVLLCLAPCAVWSWVGFPHSAREYCGACGCPTWIGSRLSVKNACLLHPCPEGRHPPIQISHAGTVPESSSVGPPSTVR